jgi:hypothetical protein
VKVIAIDPGGFTGLATWTNGEWWHGFLGGKKDSAEWNHHAQLEMFLELQITEETVIVCESFEYRNGLDRAELISCEYIGVVKLVAQRFGVPLAMQTASMGLGWMTDDRLKMTGTAMLPVSTKPNKDMNSASKHLWYYLCNNRGVPIDLRVAMIRKRSGK